MSTTEDVSQTDEQLTTNPAADLTGFQRDLLIVISTFEEPPSGQSIKDRAEKTNGYKINHGRLYPNLDTLVHKDLVEKGQIDRRTNCYVLASEGQQLVEQYATFVGE